MCVSKSLVFHLPISPSDVSCTWLSFRLSYRRTVRNPGMAVNCPVPELLPCAVRYKDPGHAEAITGPSTWTQTQISVRLELRTQKRRMSLPFSGPHGFTQPPASSPMPQPRRSLLSAAWMLTTQWWSLCESVTDEWKWFFLPSTHQEPKISTARKRSSFCPSLLVVFPEAAAALQGNALEL